MQRKSSERLTARTLGSVRQEVQSPGFVPREHEFGIVHLGLGAFHRAHQAAYTDTALAKRGGDWRITGVSMRSTETADAMMAQDGLYTLLQRGPEGTVARVIGSIGAALSLSKDRDRIARTLSAAETKIVSLTVTEKAYCFDAGRDRMDLSDRAIAQDLEKLEQPQTVPGLLAQALRHRRRRGVGGIAIMSCDNLPANGRVVRQVVLDFARNSDPDLEDWIVENVSFPSTMVDRITPKQTSDDTGLAERLTGLHDAVPVQCEDFSQWVVEDDFPTGRPAWETAGAIFVGDVGPYEKMKLRMLNGSHSLLAYSGHISGIEFIGDCMRDSALRRLAGLHMERVRGNLAPLAGIDYAAYADELTRRFENPGIAHATYQIAMDGSQKMPQRIFELALEALERGSPIDTFAFATAVWFRYLLGITETGTKYHLRDPKEREIALALDGQGDASSIVASLLSVDGLLPQPLFSKSEWIDAITGQFTRIADVGVRDAADSILASAS